MGRQTDGTKGNTLLRYAIMQYPNMEYIAVCAPCDKIILNKSLDQCPGCGYYLAWNRVKDFSGQGVRSDYLQDWAERDRCK